MTEEESSTWNRMAGWGVSPEGVLSPEAVLHNIPSFEKLCVGIQLKTKHSSSATILDDASFCPTFSALGTSSENAGSNGDNTHTHIWQHPRSAGIHPCREPRTGQNFHESRSTSYYLLYILRVGLNIPQSLFLAIFAVVSDRRTEARWIATFLVLRLKLLSAEFGALWWRYRSVIVANVKHLLR